MVKQRIKEIVDFASSESPYRSANKGWITDDVYIQWKGKLNKEDLSKEGSQIADIAIYWNPIKYMTSILLLVLLITSIVVGFLISLAHGKFQINISEFDFQAPIEVSLNNSENINENKSIFVGDPISESLSTNIDDEISQEESFEETDISTVQKNVSTSSNFLNP